MWNYPPVVLASSSPRRTEILTQLRIPHSICVPDIDEQCEIENPSERVMHLAQKKAEAVRVINDKDIIIAADTIVALPNSTYSKQKKLPSHSIFEKPHSRQHAFDMLGKLSNRMHEVYTGISILYRQEITTQYDCAKVQFNKIDQEHLQKYLDTEEWQGVAGGYRIQGIGACFIQRIEGNYSTIMGLPIPLLCAILDSYKSLSRL